MKHIPQNVKKIYLMGICGTGMGSMAGLLQQMGYEVSGSDEGMYPPMSEQLRALNIKVYTPFAAENLEKAKPDLVIVGNVMMEKYPESQALLKLNIPYTSMPEAMRHFLLRDKDVIVIAGTHGKTTTTSLMTFLLKRLGEDVGYFIGGISKDFGKSFTLGKSRYFVIEGDEYDTAFFEKTPKFIHYNPKHVIITSLEFDHADIYRDLAHVTESFKKLSALIPKSGSLHFCHDYKTLDSVTPLCQAWQQSYGHAANATGSNAWVLQNYRTTAYGSEFSIQSQAHSVVHLQSPLFGEYNALNVIACFSVLQHLGLPLEKASLALRDFQGIKRRQDVLYADEHWVVLDDFAHHPTAVRETIKAIRQKFPQHRLIAVFEPRSNTSLRDVFQNDYATAFEGADEVHFPPILNAHKVKDGRILDIHQLTQDIRKQNIATTLHPNTQSIIDTLLTQKTKTANAVLIMTNGGFENIHQRLITALQKQKT